MTARCFLSVLLVFSSSVLSARQFSFSIPEAEVLRLTLEEQAALDVVGRDGSDLIVVLDQNERLAQRFRHAKNYKFAVPDELPARTLEAFAFAMASHAKSNEKGKIIELGRSSEDRKILALRLQAEKQEKPALFITGTLHAREWSSLEAVLGLIDAFLSDEYAEWLDSVLETIDIVLVPLVNPDGYRFSYTTDRLWRKSRWSDDATNDRVAISTGIDLNRNFPFHFNIEKNSDPASPSYPGPSSAVAPEVLALLDVMESEAPVGWLDVHAYGQLFLHPWAYTKSEPEGIFELLSFADPIRDALLDLNPPCSYAVGQPSVLLPLPLGAGGSLMDYVYGTYAVPSFAVELRPTLDSPQGFALRKDDLALATRDLVAIAQRLATLVARSQVGAVDDPPLKSTAGCGLIVHSGRH